jgi:hypothetical protein
MALEIRVQIEIREATVETVRTPTGIVDQRVLVSLAGVAVPVKYRIKEGTGPSVLRLRRQINVDGAQARDTGGPVVAEGKLDVEENARACSVCTVAR